MKILAAFLVWSFSLCTSAGSAQDLDPRAYARLPVKTSTLVTGFVYSSGGVLTDATLPIQDVEAQVESLSLGFAHSFSFLGLTSQALVAVPYSWAQVSAQVAGQPQRVTRSGLSDTRLRWSVLLVGAPAVTMEEFRKAPRKTVIGFSLNMIVPTGQFFSDKLINLGTNRWSFRPEVALSHPIGERWLIDVYPGVWFFTKNTSFFPGSSVRTQKPMGTLQVHLSYTVRPLLWVALNATYYRGGQSSIDEIYNDDRQANSRIGVTSVFPLGKGHSIKVSASTGAVVRIGHDFTTISVGWAKSWVGKLRSAK